MKKKKSWLIYKISNINAYKLDLKHIAGINCFVGNFYFRAEDDARTKIEVGNCDLNDKPCTVNIKKGQLTLGLSSGQLQALKPINIRVKTKNIKAKRVSLEITGVNMDMGILTGELKKASNDEFTGTTVPGFCSLSKMLWQASLAVDTDDTAYAINFAFSTNRN